MSDVKSLLKRVQEAAGPDDELDWELTQLADPGAVRYSSAHQHYTASVDSALALVERLLPDWQMEQVAWGKDKGGPIIASIGNFGRADEYRCGYGDASTVPLAILAALLSALSSIKEVGK